MVWLLLLSSLDFFFHLCKSFYPSIPFLHSNFSSLAATHHVVCPPHSIDFRHYIWTGETQPLLSFPWTNTNHKMPLVEITHFLVKNYLILKVKGLICCNKSVQEKSNHMDKKEKQFLLFLARPGGLSLLSMFGECRIYLKRQMVTSALACTQWHWSTKSQIQCGASLHSQMGSCVTSTERLLPALKSDIANMKFYLLRTSELKSWNIVTGRFKNEIVFFSHRELIKQKIILQENSGNNSCSGQHIKLI